jgi:hypothetical protein
VTILQPDELFRVQRADALEFLRSLPDRCVDLTFKSPPYEAQRDYPEDGSPDQPERRGQAWVDWLRPIVVECCRVSRGLCCLNMASPLVDGRYTASVEWLVADLTRLDGLVCGPAPHAWVKSENHDDAPGNGMPGSGGSHYQRRDWEPVYSFCRPDRLPLAWSDNTAFGKPPRYRPGGEMSNRGKSGDRANATGKGRRVNFGHAKDGTVKGGHARDIGGPVANPGNVVTLASDVCRVPVGGGKLGHALAHAGDAPMPLGLAERFVCWYCPPGGVVLDCFFGTGTTLHAAKNHGRRFVGCDVRPSQVRLTEARAGTVTANLF